MKNILIAICFLALIFFLTAGLYLSRSCEKNRLVYYHASAMGMESSDFILDMNRMGYHLITVIPSEKDGDMVYVFEKD